ncbi:hypothetical protein GETHLI_06910 [Geothrix limicola]|uniref:Rhodanese domain-containing protein n=1 Tax=Geothrix limicola TaxID=2927978 RepID=A0ABQ5QBJ3_9BACT|nr:rhodanese-like domain-containing protein [Geothrix limicola]GLH72189.1 hypothetical protein GETHLI_06910 [Geothrix limicola]
MTISLRSPSTQILALAALAVLAALVSNGLASPARRLSWRRSVSPLLGPPPPMTWPQAPTAPAAAPASAPSVAAVETQPQRPTPPPRAAAPRTAPPEAPQPQETQASTPIREITGAEAWKAFQSGAPFLDARRSAEFAEGHIAKAWCTPVWESDLEDRLISFKAARHPGAEDPIVIYCSGGDCRDSHLLAAKLLNEGYFHLLIYHDGYPGWVSQGHPIEKGQP